MRSAKGSKHQHILILQQFSLIIVCQKKYIYYSCNNWKVLWFIRNTEKYTFYLLYFQELNIHTVV